MLASPPGAAPDGPRTRIRVRRSETPPIERRWPAREMTMAALDSSRSITDSTPLVRAAWARRAAAALPLALALALAAAPIAGAAGVRGDHPNLVGGELLGRGFVLTVNYERYLNNNFGLGGGLMGFGTSDGTVGIMPLYASFLSGDAHSLYLAAGGALLGGGGAVHDYE